MKKVYILAFVALLAAYLILAMTLPSDPQVLAKHGLTQASARMLNMTTLIPLSLIYLAALYGFIRVKDYADKVRRTKEGPGFSDLALGLGLLAFSLPIRAIVGNYATYVRHAEPQLVAEISILRNYLTLVFAFAALFYIAKGAEALLDTLRRSALRERSLVYSLAGPIILASLYTWLIVESGPIRSGDAPYYMPEWAVITTLAIPLVFTWCLGAWAAFQLYKYHHGVKGVIYKRAINNLAIGVAAIVIIAILTQFITTLSGTLNRLDLQPLLIIVYVLVAVYAVGYGLVARGAKKLKQLEEV
jgi:hypothetical protein